VTAVLSGDVGGTKTLLRLTAREGGEVLHERRYESGGHSTLESMLVEFLGSAPTRASAACLAVAGPVRRDAGSQSARLTNLPWRITAQGIAEATGLREVRLLNDFEAIAYSLDTLPDESMYRVRRGQAAAPGVRAIAGAGTGFGVCAAVGTGPDMRVVATEAGHSGFAPADAQQRRLLDYLSRDGHRATREDCLCGRGLATLLRFVERDTGRPAGAELQRALSEGDPAAAVTAFALEARDPVAVEALALFVRIYGSVLGDLALEYMASAGVFVAGGIAPRILPALTNGELEAAFLAKPPMDRVVEATPLCVILDTSAGLRGATELAKALVD
jgi:glucokinase